MVKRDSFLVHQVKSFSFAIEGIAYSFKKGTHFKIHTITAIAVVVLGLFYTVSPLEWLVLILTISAVISAETMNTAIEETCDILHPDEHPKARLAKHCAAGAVLILSVAAAAIGIIIFAPKII
ncbi:MAG: diacylglycerol kinase family protein [Candidatus Curtissbacteria bacterium]|nr:diacylglycerol kinase family protein [Candidatus Curtissbacteria bacterium]